jgi:hypothetical protein
MEVALGHAYRYKGLTPRCKIVYVDPSTLPEVPRVMRTVQAVC